MNYNNYNMMTSTSRPPFYWKVPAPEKDYMFENVQRIRKTVAQNKQRGAEPMKAAFIPGVTKNPKYFHITSRVGEYLRPNAEKGDAEDAAFDSTRAGNRIKLYSSSSANKLPNKSSQNHNQKFQNQSQQGGRGSGPGPGNGPGAGSLINRRLSRSSTDLSSMAKKKTGSNVGVQSAGQIGVDGPGNYVPRAKRKPRGLQAEDESVYNWRFSDSNVNCNLAGDTGHNPFTLPHPGNEDPTNESMNNSRKHFHRVEYLPCDGICADETVVDERGMDGGDGGGGGSGRSSSRTSRGMNTEETRIIDDFQNLDIQHPQRNHSNQNPIPNSYMRERGSGGSQGQNQKERNLGQRQGHGSGQFKGPHPREFNNWMEADDRGFSEGGDRDGGGEDGYGGHGHNQNNGIGSHVSFRQNKSLSNSNENPNPNLRNASSGMPMSVMKNTYGGGGSGGSGRGPNPNSSSTDLPHSLGTVPKYLKQRKEEWKCEAERVNAAAAYNADVPPGHVLLSEEERVETLDGLKSKYSTLIDELNRVPIRIDTMRVREYKIQLEQQLQKLERGMAIFSRSRVYVKLPDPGPGAGTGIGGVSSLNSQQLASSKLTSTSTRDLWRN